MAKKISGMTAVLAANLDDTALMEVVDKLGATRKATVAQLRTAIAAGAIAFLSTVSVAGQLTSTIGNNLKFLYSASATTGYQSMQVKNTGAWLIFGIEGNTPSTLVTNDTAYSTVLVTQNATDLILGTDQTARVKIAHTTGSVTLTSLAGVGSRAVVADANGVLSAP